MLKQIYKYKFTLITTVIILILSLMSSSEVPSTKLWDFKGIDKWVHLTMYLGLSSIYFTEKNWKKQKKSKEIITSYNIFPIFILIIMGGIIELIQPILANRSCELMDFIANTTGILLGFKIHPWLNIFLKSQKIM